jgi:hypothetical protein
MHGFDEKGFGEETLLRKAMNIMADRLQKQRVWRNVYVLKPSRYYIANDVMSDSNLVDNDQNRRNLLWHQLYWLSQPNGPGDDGPAFPNVHLHAFHQKSKVQGRARLGLVTIKSVGKNIRQLGEFDVQLNRYMLGSGGDMDTPEEWASTIAHEMLHNLGHNHAGGDYTDEWQINVLDKAVLYDGYYKALGYGGAGEQSSHMACGGTDW